MEAVGQLTGGVAHDFNNLLMVVMGNLQLVEQLVKNDERATKRIRAALEAADKGSDLTKRMLAFSRLQTLQNKEISANELIMKMTDMLQHAVSATVDLKIIPQDGLWLIKADQTMLETAILNLAINARDAMKPKGGKLIIETANRHLDSSLLQRARGCHHWRLSWKSPSPIRVPALRRKILKRFSSPSSPRRGRRPALASAFP